MLNNASLANQFLNINTLEENKEYIKIGYLEDINSKVSKIDTGYYVTIIKDINSNIITGTLWFNKIDKDYINSGLTALALKRKPVSIRFVTSNYNGSLTLVISEISAYTGEFPFNKFIGEVPDAKNIISSIEQNISKALGAETKLNSAYINDSLISIYNGRCGGYAKLLQLVIFDLLRCAGLPNINLKELIMVFIIVQDRYYRYLKMITDVKNTSILSNAGKLKFISESSDICKNSGNIDLYVESCLGELCGLYKAEYLYSILIADAFERAKQTLNLCTSLTTMVLGAKKEMNGRCLIKS